MTINDMLKKLNYEKTTPVQDGLFSAYKKASHIVAVAKTGTGKTHAYLLPMLASLNPASESVQAVILVPTNELVVQVGRMLKEADPDVFFRAYAAGTDKKREALKLKNRQPAVVIATPARLFHLVFESRALVIKDAKTCVLDEADMMFDHDFLPLVDQLLSAMKNARLILSSATITPAMEPFIRRYFGAHTLIDTTDKDILRIEHRIIKIRSKNRLDVVSELAKALNPFLCLVFASRKEDIADIHDRLQEDDLPVIMISSDIGIRRRQAILEDIRALKYVYVVTSDLAARGLDLDVSHVIHTDLPRHLEFYTHRVGRTGRMGKTGISILLEGPDDHRKIARLKTQGVDFTEWVLKDGVLTETKKAVKQTSERERLAMKSVRKPKKVKPNAMKKYREKLKKARETVRRKQDAQNR
jgi:ATP-dependent RNA helicase CshB